MLSESRNDSRHGAIEIRRLILEQMRSFTETMVRFVSRENSISFMYRCTTTSVSHEARDRNYSLSHLRQAQKLLVVVQANFRNAVSCMQADAVASCLEIWMFALYVFMTPLIRERLLLECFRQSHLLALFRKAWAGACSLLLAYPTPSVRFAAIDSRARAHACPGRQ